VSTDPNYAAKAADVQALKISPPKGSIVLSIDEKTSIQALEQPSGWVREASGRIVRGLKSTYVRHGTVNLFEGVLSTDRGSHSRIL
jgi:hypothetical protein